MNIMNLIDEYYENLDAEYHRIDEYYGHLEADDRGWGRVPAGRENLH